MSKTKSEMAQRLDGLQAKLRPMLKRLGYRVHGRTFNRSTADGLTQVVHIQMGRLILRAPFACPASHKIFTANAPST
jgi:hypothetical protein